MVLTCALLAISGGPFGLQVPARFTDHNMDIYYDWEIDPRTTRHGYMMNMELQYEANDRQADGRQMADTNGRTAVAQQTKQTDVVSLLLSVQNRCSPTAFLHLTSEGICRDQ